MARRARTMLTRGPRRLANLIEDSFRQVMIGALAVVLVTSLLAGWLLLGSRPEVARYERGVGALQASHNAMLDMETGVRGYLSTGDTKFLQPYEQGRQDVLVADDGLLGIARNPRLTAGVVDLNVAQRTWIEGWAAPQIRAAAQRTAQGVQSTPAERVARLDSGKTLFDEYRTVHRKLTAGTEGVLDADRRNQVIALVAASASAVIVGLLMLLGAMRRRRVLLRDLVTPVSSLIEGIEDVRTGNYDRTITTTGPVELMEVVAGFNSMVGSLAESRREAEHTRAHIEEQSHRLRTILRMVREIGGSLNLKYVLQSIVNGVQDVTTAERVTVWLVNENEASLSPVRDSAAPVIDSYEPLELGTGPVGRAAKYGRTTWAGAQDEDLDLGSVAVPLIVGARVVGVLEMALPDRAALGEDQIEVLETLSIHAAAAIEAARLHDVASTAAEHDALTRLANRRRMEADLTLECERSLRYGRPVALIMLDLDHFKRLNDTYGHARGDEVLQGVAETISATLRATDTAYRFGGEELVVLARESDAEGTLVLAERIRTSIERRFAGRGESGVTASLGIAAVPAHAASPKALIEAADAALYVSKHEGRNRSTIATASPGHDRHPSLSPVPLPAAAPAEVGRAPAAL